MHTHTTTTQSHPHLQGGSGTSSKGSNKGRHHFQANPHTHHQSGAGSCLSFSLTALLQLFDCSCLANGKLHPPGTCTRYGCGWWVCLILRLALCLCRVGGIDCARPASFPHPHPSSFQPLPCKPMPDTLVSHPPRIQPLSHTYLHQARLTKKNLISLRGGTSSTCSDGCGSATSTILIPSPNTSSCAGAYLPSCMGQSPGDVITKAAQSLAKEKERQRKEKRGGTERGKEGGKAGGESGTAWKEWGLVRPRKETVEKHYKLGKKVRRRKKGGGGGGGGSKGGLEERREEGARGQGGGGWIG